MTEYSVQPNYGRQPVAWNSGRAEYPVMPKRGPYLKKPKVLPPKWRKTYILEWRIHRKMTQEQLAEAAELSPGQIADLEKGEVGYSPESLQALADALKVSRGTLLDTAPPSTAVQKPAAEPRRGIARRA